MASSTLVLSPTATPFPWSLLATAAYVNATVEYDIDAASPSLKSPDGKPYKDHDDILNSLEASLPEGDSTKKPFFISFAKNLATISAYTDAVVAVDTLDDHLAYRTFLIGHAITSADLTVWGALKGNIQILGILKRNQHPHLSRWYAYIEALEPIQQAIHVLNHAKANKARSQKTASSFDLGLPGAVEGQVVTRFPPEPSGYLHIGHTKAAILNQHFAAMYKGKLIVRFDDTNPSKEKEEYATTILEDLAKMGIRGDIVTHTSDHFDKLHEYGIAIIRAGKAYADDTNQETMRHERWEGIPSKRRDSTPEENLKIFEKMTTGEQDAIGWCIRAKISVDNPNKALRDPVIFRTNLEPHHRTGSKWKVYPTYDFACPIVDAIEGVSHALRTNEYRDRNPQYEWMLEALNLRKVIIWDFSRVNFIYTLLSKRKLLWFVENGHVSGWDDPRFPTVRGILRRGMTVEALKQYMLSQGPSQSVISLEWDSIWALNKKIIDPIAPRYWAVECKDMVEVAIHGVSTTSSKDIPLLKKNPEAGTKKTIFSPKIFTDQEDAASFDDNEEITLMDWGNAIVNSVTKSSSGIVQSVIMTLHLEGDFKKTKKKIHWLSESTQDFPHTLVTLVDYDYLITKKKLEETDEFKDFVNLKTEFRTKCVADFNVEHSVKQGDIIQFERKGYFICDGRDDKKSLVFIKIPDGKAASLASKHVSAGGAMAPERVEANTRGEPGKLLKGSTAKAGAQSPANILTPTKSSTDKQKSRADSSDANDNIHLSEGSAGFEIPVTSQMYSAERVYGASEVQTDIETKMYAVGGHYHT